MPHYYKTTENMTAMSICRRHIPFMIIHWTVLVLTLVSVTAFCTVVLQSLHDFVRRARQIITQIFLFFHCVPITENTNFPFLLLCSYNWEHKFFLSSIVFLAYLLFERTTFTNEGLSSVGGLQMKGLSTVGGESSWPTFLLAYPDQYLEWVVI